MPVPRDRVLPGLPSEPGPKEKSGSQEASISHLTSQSLTGLSSVTTTPAPRLPLIRLVARRTFSSPAARLSSPASRLPSSAASESLPWMATRPFVFYLTITRESAGSLAQPALR